MSAIVGVAVALLAIGSALRMARTQGVPGLPLLGWSLLLAVAVSAIYGVGALLAFKVIHHRPTQLVTLFASIVLAVAVGIWLSRRVWTRLQQKSAKR